MPGWTTTAELVRWELVESAQEGRSVDDLRERAAGIEEGNERAWMELYESIRSREVSADFPFSEPNSLEGIRAERPAGPRILPAALNAEGWADRFRGAWLGRCVGCALGLPLETGPFTDGHGDRPGWKNIELWFRGADAWPIAGYVPGESRAKAEYGFDIARERRTWREAIDGMISDDDIRYTVLGLLLLEKHGFGFDSWDVGKLWHQRLPYASVCTAETQAYLNFARVTHHLNAPKPSDWPEKIDWVPTHLNPYREWIGAQIRVDALAYAAAGRPELAAELAWKDASFSHVKNGIYGAMFCSAMIAAAFVEPDPSKLVAIGLSEIPSNSRLAHDVRQAIAIASSSNDQLELVRRLHEAFDRYFWIHTNNNAALVAAALIHGAGDFERTVTTAVLGAWDTDCNGATAGSIIGACLGARGIPEKWSAPLNDRLLSDLPGFHPIAISACAERSHALFRKLQG